MPNTTLANGQSQRKTLASQLDRLDSILDALSDGLNEAVQTVVEQTVKHVVREAVETAVSRALADQDLRRRLTEPEPLPVRRSAMADGANQVWSKFVRFANGCWNGAVTLVQQAGTAIRRVAGACRAAAMPRATSLGRKVASAGLVTAIWTMLLARLAARLRRPLAVGIGVGLVVGAACYLAGPVTGAVVSGLNSLLLTLAAVAMIPAWPVPRLPRIV